MDTKLTVALACAAALAFGTCSGGNPRAPAAPDRETADPGTAETETTKTAETTDPPENGRTEAERFDAVLAKAAADLTAARNRVARAVAATAAVGTGDGRTSALAEIANARKDLTDALAAARALEAQVGLQTYRTQTAS